MDTRNTEPLAGCLRHFIENIRFAQARLEQRYGPDAGQIIKDAIDSSRCQIAVAGEMFAEMFRDARLENGV